jgi:hypothetical protein
MCEHLKPLENYLVELGISETFRGQAWSKDCREWVYFDCILKTDSLKYKFKLPPFIIIHENLDNKSGMEQGLVCTECKDAIMGLHPDFATSIKAVVVK